MLYILEIFETFALLASRNSGFSRTSGTLKISFSFSEVVEAEGGQVQVAGFVEGGAQSVVQHGEHVRPQYAICKS